MNKKVIHLGEQRRKRKPRSPEEAAKIAYRRFCDPAFLESIGEEPVGLASGKTNAQGGFVRDDEEDLLADGDRNDEHEK